MEKRTRKFGDLFLKYAIWGDELRVDKDSLYINTENYKKILEEFDKELNHRRFFIYRFLKRKLSKLNSKKNE
jgi:hypothetical protein